MKHKPIKYDHGMPHKMYCTPEGLEVPKESLGTGLIEWLVTSTTPGSQDRCPYDIKLLHILYYKYT